MHYGDNIYEIIAENIKRERKRLRISQLVLAEKADVSVDTVKSLESGRRAMSLETYLRIVQAFWKVRRQPCFTQKDTGII